MIDTVSIERVFLTQMKTPALSITPMNGLINNSVYRVEAPGGPYIFKVYRKRDWPEDGKLPFICERLDEYAIPHARLYAFNREDAAFPGGYLIEECLPGTTADRLTLTVAEKAQLFGQLGALVSEVHRIPLRGYGYIGDGAPALWSSFSEYMYDTFTDQAPNLTRRGLMTEVELRSLNDRLRPLLRRCDVFPPVLCHGDLAMKNMLIDSAAERLTLIDWDDAQSLCWMADIARLTLWLKLNDREDAAACRAAFLSRYQMPCEPRLFDELEAVLHVWYALDYLGFFTEESICVRIQALLDEARDRCGV